MSGAAGRRPLLLFVAAADHPHRDVACATLSWLAEAGGAAFECYFEAPASGAHYGGGHPAAARLEDLRGGTFTGGHHLEQLLLLVNRFDCQAVCLGAGLLTGLLRELDVPVRAEAATAAALYAGLLEGAAARPEGVLLVGDGGAPQQVSLAPYAFPEVAHRRLLALVEGDDEGLAALTAALGAEPPVDGLWLRRPPGDGVTVIETAPERTVAAQTAWMARRWREVGRGFLLGDPELVARWTPEAVRRGWLPLFGIPQADAIRLAEHDLRRHLVVYGRQQHDADFLALSRAGVSFQLIDPGRPAFPVIREAGLRPPAPAAAAGPDDPSDEQLRTWAGEGRVLASLLFWTGMARELENLYVLADALSLSRLAAGVVLTSASYEYMPHPPLTLLDAAASLGGLAPRVEPLLASGGLGAFMESATPPDRLAAALRAGRDVVAAIVRDPAAVPTGWWGTMDAALERLARPPRVSRLPDAPFLQLRYRPGDAEPNGGNGGAASNGAAGGGPAGRQARLRALVKASPARHLFQALRPFDGHRPGAASRAVLEAVAAAGFRYAFTKSCFGPTPRVVTGVDGLTVLNYTAGRWDGWTPFETVNRLSDLRLAERRLLRGGRPGWLVSTFDTCLWAFSGSVWERGGRLREICDWMAAGGGSGRLVNVPPRVLARYAALLLELGLVEPAEAR